MKKRMGMLVFVLIVCAALGLTLLACDSSEQSGYSVAFEANGGSAVEGLSGVTEVAEAPSSVRTGYTLEGWYLASDLSGEAVTFPLTVTADTTLYAKWSANTYTVSFDYTTADGGIGESSIEGTYGSALGALFHPHGHALHVGCRSRSAPVSCGFGNALRSDAFSHAGLRVPEPSHKACAPCRHCLRNDAEPGQAFGHPVFSCRGDRHLSRVHGSQAQGSCA